MNRHPNDNQHDKSRTRAGMKEKPSSPAGAAAPPGVPRSQAEVSVHSPDAGSGDPACKGAGNSVAGPAHSAVGARPAGGTRDMNEPPPRRRRRLHRGWPDREGNISYLLTMCVEGRAPVLNNEVTFERLTSFLLDSPARYRWFGRRFVIMPDHVHLIAHMGYEAIRLGQWIKALKAVVGGLKPIAANGRAAGSGDPAGKGTGNSVAGPGSSPVIPQAPKNAHPFTRIARSWRWQAGCHDHKFRTPESESRKWEYVCLNPVRYCSAAQITRQRPFNLRLLAPWVLPNNLWLWNPASVNFSNSGSAL